MATNTCGCVPVPNDVAINTGYGVTGANMGQMLDVTATGSDVTLSLLSAATAGNGFMFYVKRNSGSSMNVIIDPNSSETIDGSSTKTLSTSGQTVQVICDGTNWFTVSTSSGSGGSGTTPFGTSESTFGASGSINNYDAASFWTNVLVRWAGVSGDGTLTGVNNGTKGRVYFVRNNHASYTLTFAHESSSSSAANRFTCPNGADFVLAPGTGVLLVYDNTSSRWVVGTVKTIYNSDVATAAAIAYSKLNLSGSVVNADINAAAAIAYSKLALTGTIVNADVSAAAAIAYSKLNLTGGIVNADINASAAIVYSKLSLTGGIVNADINASAAIANSKLNLASIAQDVAFAGKCSPTGEFDLAGVISPAQITASQNNWNPTGLSTASVVRIDTDNNWAITGLAGGAAGRIIVLVNITSAKTLQISHESASSTAANRFSIYNDGTYTPALSLPPNGCAVFMYDGTTQRWRFLNNNPIMNLGGGNVVGIGSISNGCTNGSTASAACRNILAESVEMPGVITVTPSSSQNDYNPVSLSTSSIIRFDPTANIDVTGLQGGASGRLMTILNVSSTYSVTLYDESANSTAQYRFKLGGTATSLRLDPNHHAVILYDSTSSRWRLVGSSKAPVGAAVAVPSCRVYRNTTQNISNNTSTAVQWNNETYDNDSMHDNVTNNTRITIRTAGKYHLFATANFQSNATSFRILYFLVNGSVVLAPQETNGVTSNDTHVTTTCCYQFNSGDYVECIVYQSSGSTLTVGETGGTYTVFGAQLVEYSYAQNLQALTVPSCRVSRSSNASFTTGSPITFDTEQYDNDNIHDTASNTSRLTCRTAGKYRIYGNVEYFQDSTGSLRGLTIKLNNATYLAYEQRIAQANASIAPVIDIQTTYQLNVGDYVELIAVHDKGSALQVDAFSPTYPHFGMELVEFASAAPNKSDTIQSKTAAFTADMNGGCYLCDASSAAFTVTLTSAATVGAGARMKFIKTNSNSNRVTIDAASSETINGALTNELCAQYAELTIVSDGTNWIVENCYDSLSTTSTSGTTLATTGNYKEMGNLSIPAGIWELTLVTDVTVNGATISGNFTHNLNTTSASAGTLGDTEHYLSGLTTAGINGSGTITYGPYTRTTTGTVYANVMGTYSAGGPPKYYMRFQANRIG